MSRARFAGFEIKLPAHPFMRIGLGILLVGGGLVGFLPILGFWMIPLGLVILSVDLPPVRRFRRRFTVKLGHWLNRRWPDLARRIGFGQVRSTRMD